MILCPAKDELALPVRGGASYAITDRPTGHTAVGVGVTREAPDLVVTVGLTWSF
jgi:hypothetical protein